MKNTLKDAVKPDHSMTSRIGDLSRAVDKISRNVDQMYTLINARPANDGHMLEILSSLDQIKGTLKSRENSHSRIPTEILRSLEDIKDLVSMRDNHTRDSVVRFEDSRSVHVRDHSSRDLEPIYRSLEDVKVQMQSLSKSRNNSYELTRSMEEMKGMLTSLGKTQSQSIF